MSTTVYVSIGNSDDKLTQKEWASFHEQVDEAIHKVALTTYGHWLSESSARWQNACWCFELLRVDYAPLKQSLSALARNYQQDSIAWAEAPETEFL